MRKINYKTVEALMKSRFINYSTASDKNIKTAVIKGYPDVVNIFTKSELDLNTCDDILVVKFKFNNKMK
jgi:hypothetical protein